MYNYKNARFEYNSIDKKKQIIINVYENIIVTINGPVDLKYSVK